MNILTPAALLLTAGLLSAQPSITSQYTFTAINYPNAFETFPLGLNDQRVVTGFFIDMNGVSHGFLWKKGKFTQLINYPGAGQFPGGGTIAGGINNRGDVVGTYSTPDGFQHGFKLARPDECGENNEGDDDDNNNAHACKPVYSTIDVPGAAQINNIDFEFGPGLGTAAIGINNNGVITGMYATNGLYSNAYFLAGGHYKPLDSPFASHLAGNGTKCFSINSSGAAACDYLTQATPGSPKITNGFVYDNGKTTKIFVPGSGTGGFGTQINGINDSRKMVGTFTVPSGTLAGLVWYKGDYFTLNYPAAPLTELHSINNRGEITGAYVTDLSTGIALGFIAIPK